MQSSFRLLPPTPRPVAAGGTESGGGLARRRWVLASVGAVTLVLLGAAIWWLYLRPSEAETKVGRFGVALTAPWLAYATSPANRPYLGDPIWTGRFEGRECVAFEFYIACRDQRDAVRNTPEEFGLVDLGRRTLPPALVPTNARPDPVVQAYLDRLERAGVPYRYWLGTPISDAFCVTGGAGGAGECVQFFTRMQLKWSAGTSPANPDAVHLTPLGLQVPRP